LGRDFLTTNRAHLWNPATLIFVAAGSFAPGMLSGFFALSHGKVVIVEPLVSSNPVTTLLPTLIFLRDVESLTLRMVTGAALTVTGTVLVVLVK
jgi:uncharacterized membrane protein